MVDPSLPPDVIELHEDGEMKVRITGVGRRRPVFEYDTVVEDLRSRYGFPARTIVTDS